MATEFPVPETKVLAIESHVVYGYVGNRIATFVLQAMGCEVSPMNTVHFSNHTGYGQIKGTKTTADEIRDLYAGLQQSYLTDFDAMLTGYAPNAAAVEAVGLIGRDLQLKAATKPGSFFWVLDPVMGDHGKLYVAEDVVPAYKSLIRSADLILPNQFEAEVLSDTKITSLQSLAAAISVLHKSHQIPHVIVTSIRLPETPSVSGGASSLTIVGSTARSDGSPRLFRVTVPAIDCYFSGTGDMFSALTLVRLREAAIAAGLDHLKSWTSPDDVTPTDLPLARAVEKVLGSMHAILEKTNVAREAELEALGGPGGVTEMERDSEKRTHLRRSKAAELRVVRNVRDLLQPEVRFRAEEVVVESE